MDKFSCGSQTLDDFLSYDVSEVQDYVTIKDATSAEEAFIRMAWYLMVRNIDLGNFAVCRAYGGGVSGEILDSALHGGITVNMEDWDFDLTPEFPFVGRNYDCIQILFSQIEIVRDCWADQWNRVYGVWRKPCEPADRVLAAIELSAWLFHEVMHFCFGHDEPLAAENLFRWAMYNRYWCAITGNPEAVYRSCDGMYEEGSGVATGGSAVIVGSGGVSDFLVDNDTVSIWGARRCGNWSECS